MTTRRFEVGAEIVAGGVHVRVWAPLHRSVAVVVEEGAAIPLEAEERGYFSGIIAAARAGTRYRFRLSDDPKLYPDPASRFQPAGPEGPSEVIDPGLFAWRHPWRGARETGQVIYEMHIGTFTEGGTYASATADLARLADVGVTLLEVMPLHEFPGKFGWGYDGVNLYAPSHLYGAPDDFRSFVDAAHGLGLGVILDVVYNHLGPDGNYLKRFSPDYFTDRYLTDWGEAINFDGENSRDVREFFAGNAAYWIEEFHLDGLRIDATQCLFDETKDHVTGELTRRARAASGGRPIYVVGENEPQDARLVRSPSRGGLGLDALWNDDWHHTAMVALTGRSEAYYKDYKGSPQELVSAARWGFLFHGQRYCWQKKRRGSAALDLPPHRFVCFLQNHDQVANSGHGDRIHKLAMPGQLRALTALLLLGPSTPMLFQGQEFAASAPFLFFADHSSELAEKVRAGRKEFLRQFRSLATEEAQAALTDPADPATFARCKLSANEAREHTHAIALHRDLLALRKSDPVFGVPRTDRTHGAVLASSAFLLRFIDPQGDRLLIVNLGRDLHLDPAPEPLLAPPEDAHWEVLWSSEDVRYGGSGTPAPETDENWEIPGNAAMALLAKGGTTWR